MIEPIITYINEQLSANAFADVRYAKAQIIGIASLQQRHKDGGVDQVPVYWSSGKLIDVLPDARYPLQLWHRTLNVNAVDVTPTNGYGDKIMRKTTHSMALLVVFDVLKCREMAEAFNAHLMEALPVTMPKADLSALGITSLSIRHTSSNFQTAEIYSREYRSSDNRLKPNHQMIDFRYTIETTYAKGCLTNQCFCNT